MSKKAAQLAEQMAQMLEVIGVLEARITELKKMAKRNARKGKATAAAAPEKPKRPPTAWIQFTQRVRGVLAAAGQPFPRVTDLMKFCADMRAQKGVDCTDAELLAARTGWEPPTAVAAVAPVCPTCSEDIGEDPEKHRPCVRSVAAAAQAAGADPMKAVDAWSEAVHRPAAHLLSTGPTGPTGARSRTPLVAPSRRPSAPAHFMAGAAASPTGAAAALNTPSEEMVVDEV